MAVAMVTDPIDECWYGSHFPLLIYLGKPAPGPAPSVCRVDLPVSINLPGNALMDRGRAVSPNPAENGD